MAVLIIIALGMDLANIRQRILSTSSYKETSRFYRNPRKTRAETKYYL